MASARGWRFAVLGVAVVAASLALVVTGTGWVLTARYQPAPFGTEAVPAGAAWALRLQRVHEGALVALVIATVVCALVALPLLLAVRGERLQVSIAGVVAVVGAVAGAAAAAFTWGLVRWDQVALRAVTVGEDVRGLWYPAFSDEVAFVLLGEYEVSQGQFAAAVVLHLVAPLLVLLAVAVALRAALRRPLQEVGGE